MERLGDAAERVFARHETFHPRYGWFRKAVQVSSLDPGVFQAEDATVQLGVGKNMVRAIRFWGRAAKLVVDVPDPLRPRTPYTAPTLNGLALFDEMRGLDPFAELPGTLWILHWLLLRPPCILPVWWIAFNRFSKVEFSEDDLCAFVAEEIESADWESPNASSIRKDVSCFLRTYSPATKRDSIDDALDGPLRELKLVEPSWDERHRYRVLLGAKPSLPDEVVTYACLDWMSRYGGSSTATVSRLATAIGSPGRVFRLNESDLAEVLATERIPSVVMTAPGGVPQLVCTGDPGQESVAALRAYYRGAGRKIGRRTELGDLSIRDDGNTTPKVGVADRKRIMSISDPIKRLHAIEKELTRSGSR